VLNGQIYYYYLIAVNKIGESDPSNIVNSTPMGLPNPPMNLQASAGDRYINLSWEPPDYDGGAKIILYRIFKGGSVGGELYFDYVDGLYLFFNDTDVINGEEYFYYVTSVNIVGESTQSNEINAIPLAIPTPPKNPKISSGDGFVNVSWGTPGDNGGTVITKFNIYRGNESGEKVVIGSVNANTLYYNDTSVTNGIRYFYNITALNIVGESLPSIDINVTPFGLPEAPRELNAAVGDRYINLTWEAPADTGGAKIIEYKIFRGNSPADETFLNSATGNATIYSDTAIIYNQIYFYYITAVTGIGESDPSAEVNATVQEPSKPENNKTNQTDSDNTFLIVGIVGIIIVILIIIIFLIARKKKTKPTSSSSPQVPQRATPLTNVSVSIEPGEQGEKTGGQYKSQSQRYKTLQTSQPPTYNPSGQLSQPRQNQRL